MWKTSSRTILLRYVPLVVVILIDIFFLALLDNLFVNKKRALIVDSLDEFQQMLMVIDPLKERLSALNYNLPQYGRRAKEYLEKNAPDLLAGDHPWYRVALTDSVGGVIYEEANREKFHRYNNWRNCLFSQSFSAPVGSLNLNLTVFYATPVGWPKIESMVFKYRVYAVLFLLATWVIYWLLSRNVFTPMLRVHGAIERIIRSDKVALIASPVQDIELAFNQLVRNQREIYFGLEIDAIADRLHALADDNEVLHKYMPALEAAIGKIYPFEGVSAVLRGPGGEWEAPEDGAPPGALGGTGMAALDGALWIALRAGESVIGAARLGIPGRTELPRDEFERMALEIQKQAENGLARCLTRSRALIEERNRFGINIATNMGHDLTNIVASGKWDLDTIQRAQGMGIVTMDPDRGRFFEEAVDGLRNNLDFLQQMVDIYRSFGYTQKPRYEPALLSELVTSICGLFRQSTSRKLAIEASADVAISGWIEPRLMRMMLFNLLANASQAIMRGGAANGRGEIRVSLERGGEGEAVIRVRDNGPGIRDAEGNPLPPGAIARVFRSGYSTKGEGSGGGLGLSWVKSIVEDFHGGEIRAVNRPEGGAEFIIRFPLREASGEDAAGDDTA